MYMDNIVCICIPSLLNIPYNTTHPSCLMSVNESIGIENDRMAGDRRHFQFVCLTVSSKPIASWVVCKCIANLHRVCSSKKPESPIMYVGTSSISGLLRPRVGVQWRVSSKTEYITECKTNRAASGAFRSDLHEPRMINGREFYGLIDDCQLVMVGWWIWATLSPEGLNWLECSPKESGP